MIKVRTNAEDFENLWCELPSEKRFCDELLTKNGIEHILLFVKGVSVAIILDKEMLG